MQTPKNQISEITRKIIELLVIGDYRSLEQYTGGVRLSEIEIGSAIRDYGKTLVPPPLEAYSNLDIIEVENAEPPRWSVHCDLWTKEEGRSDLSLELTLINIGNKEFRVELDNIHVF